MNKEDDLQHPMRRVFRHTAMEQKRWHRFVAGGLGEMFAVSFSHPADVLKADVLMGFLVWLGYLGW